MAEGPRFSHRFANSVRRKRSGFDSAAKRSRQLIAGATFLAGTQQKDSLEPLVQLQVSILKNGTFGDTKLAFAMIAFPQAKPFNPFRMLFAWLGANAF